MTTDELKRLEGKLGRAFEALNDSDGGGVNEACEHMSDVVRAIVGEIARREIQAKYQERKREKERKARRKHEELYPPITRTITDSLLPMDRYREDA